MGKFVMHFGDSDWSSMQQCGKTLEKQQRLQEHCTIQDIQIAEQD
jgi:hypothetical protein